MIKLNIMIVYDDSNSMTGWWRKERFGSAVAEEESPQTIAKLAALLILEGYGQAAFGLVEPQRTAIEQGIAVVRLAAGSQRRHQPE